MATLRWGAVTHEGQLRTQNEDNHHAGEGLFVVADGMGGHLAGEVASEMAVTRLDERLPAGRLGSRDDLVAAINEANVEIYNASTAQRRPDRHGHHDHRDRGRRRPTRRRGAGGRQRRRLARVRAAPWPAATGHGRPQLRAGARRRRRDHRRRGTPPSAAQHRHPRARHRAVRPRRHVDDADHPRRPLPAVQRRARRRGRRRRDPGHPRHVPRRPDGHRTGAGRRRQLPRAGATTSRRS